MNRHYTGAVFMDLVTRIRRACPGIALSTDIIVGFPTETGLEFNDTVRLMQEAAFDSAFIFKYSVRPNTEAERRLKDDVPEKEKTERIVRINKIQTDISLGKNKALIGQIEPVLIESVVLSKGNSVYGRNDANKIVVLPKGNFKPGDMVQARITAATPHQLKGEPLAS